MEQGDAGSAAVFRPHSSQASLAIWRVCRVSLRGTRPASFILRSAPGQQAEGACPATAQVTLTALEDFAALIDRTGEVNSVKEQAIADLAPARYQMNSLSSEYDDTDVMS